MQVARGTSPAFCTLALGTLYCCVPTVEAERWRFAVPASELVLPSRMTSTVEAVPEPAKIARELAKSSVPPSAVENCVATGVTAGIAVKIWPPSAAGPMPFVSMFVTGTDMAPLARGAFGSA
jgi:hypothetical protein